MKVQVRVKELAEQQGMSAHELARKAGVSERTMQKLFADGNAENVLVGTLARIAEALGVPTRVLIVDGARDE